MKSKMIIMFFAIFSIMFFAMNCEVSASQAKIMVATPEKLVVKRYRNRQLELEWKKVKKADGYRVYRYDSGKKKFVKICTLGKKNYYVDKKLEIHKVYQYKVTAYRIKKGKKIFSKKSYKVSARTYGKKAKLVNAEMISGSGYNSLELGTYSNFKMSVDLEPDFYAKKLNAKVFSDKKVFYSSDETIAKIDKRGNITTFEKEGTCYIHLRAHNGVSGKVKINVVNYAQPKSFPEYNGDNKFVNLLLTDYKNEVFNITNYFTRFGKNTIVGKIKSDDNGNIVGDSNIINNSQLSSSIKKLITDFPMVMQIEYRDRWVRFYMPYSDSGAYIEVIYSADEDFSESHHRIAPHWKEYNFIPK